MENGTEVCGSDTPTYIFGGSRGIEETIITVVIREQVGEFISKKSKNGVEVVGGVDSFGIVVDVGGSKVAVVSLTSLCTGSPPQIFD